MRTQLQLDRIGKQRSAPFWLLLPAFLLVGGVGGALLGAVPADNIQVLLGAAPVTEAHMVPQNFAICTGGHRVNCVVDGDTFWLEGTKIRIADFNTPEIGRPSCATEAALGRRATGRLLDLLKAGPFQLATIDRDEDVYGRKLRIVTRNGQSIGDILVSEGLAHYWHGHRESWC